MRNNSFLVSQLKLNYVSYGFIFLPFSNKITGDPDPFHFKSTLVRGKVSGYVERVWSD